MKDLDEIEAEIAALRELKPRVRRFSKFADDHHDAIDAQIWVLEKNPDELTLLSHAREEGWAENVTDAALEALLWLDGKSDDRPSTDWLSLTNDQTETTNENI